MRSRPLLRFFSAVALPLAAYASLTTSSPGAKPQAAPVAATNTAQVLLNNFKFEPQNLTVTAGTTVTWTNKENSPHTVTADDASFSSPNLNAKATFSHTFTKPGRYAYHCAYHGGKGTGMSGTVTVVAAKGNKGRKRG